MQTTQLKHLVISCSQQELPQILERPNIKYKACHSEHVVWARTKRSHRVTWKHSGCQILNRHNNQVSSCDRRAAHSHSSGQTGNHS